MKIKDDKIKHALSQRSNLISKAVRVLIGAVRVSETIQHSRSTGADITVDVELTGGGVERWKITIERIASSH